MNKTQWGNLFKCNQCEVREFKHAQNLVRHLFWHSDPVVSRDPNDDDDVKFETSNEWLLQFKKDFMWPKNMYKWTANIHSFVYGFLLIYVFMYLN